MQALTISTRKDVEKIFLNVCKTEEDWKQVTKVAVTTIDLTHQILMSVLDEYSKLVNEEESDYAILNSLSSLIKNN